MSRHFELMEQMERERSSVAAPTKGSEYHPQPKSTDRRPITRWANDEAFRLVQQIFFVQLPVSPRVVVFAGVDHGSGCSQMCAAVAETLAKNARKPVCLMEANFRSPALTGMYGTPNQHGLTNALFSSAPIRSFTTATHVDNLLLLSSGALSIDSPNLLTADLLRDRIDELRTDCDFVIIDAPPMGLYGDAVVLGQQADGVVLVLEADATRKEAALKATGAFRAANVSILAAILNKRTYPVPSILFNRL